MLRARWGSTSPASRRPGRRRCRSSASASRVWRSIDIRLTGPIDGIELACQLRQEYGIPAIFLSGPLDADTALRAQAAQPLGLLQKPFRPSEVFNAIERALAHPVGPVSPATDRRCGRRPARRCAAFRLDPARLERRCIAYQSGPNCRPAMIDRIRMIILSSSPITASSSRPISRVAPRPAGERGRDRRGDPAAAGDRRQAAEGAGPCRPGRRRRAAPPAAIAWRGRRAAISVAEVVAAIDGDIGLTQCSVHVDECARTNYCPTRPHWAAINRAVGAGAVGGVARRDDLAAGLPARRCRTRRTRPAT